MEQTRERLPLYAAPTQTMACASVDGRAGRRSSGLNSRSVSAVGSVEAQLALPGKGGRAQQHVTGVLAVESGARGKQSEANSAKVIRQPCAVR